MRRKKKIVQIGDTIQMVCNNHIVNGFWAGTKGLLAEGHFISNRKVKRLYISREMLSNLRSAFKDYRVSLINPRMILTEKMIFGKRM